MPEQKISRVDISWGPRGHTTVAIVCEKTKQVLPVYGLERPGAVAFANLLCELRNRGMSLPEMICDYTVGGADA
jgi:hypothetical protein